MRSSLLRYTNYHMYIAYKYEPNKSLTTLEPSLIEMPTPAKKTVPHSYKYMACHYCPKPLAFFIFSLYCPPL